MQAIGRIVAIAFLAASTFPATGASPDTPGPAHKRVVAFARLYGVVRYFYPGDAAQQIDWNRFAIVGVDGAQHARGTDLQKTLTALFAPLGPGIDIAADSAAFAPLPAQANGQQTGGQPLVTWQYLGFPHGVSTYAGQRTGRGSGNLFVAVTSLLDAAPFRGKTIRLRGEIKALDASTTNGLGMWLRIDRPHKTPGFFENTSSRQKHDLDWHGDEISATVGTDASVLVFGFSMTLPDAKDPAAGFRQPTLEVRDGQGQWKPVAVPDLRMAEKPSGPWRHAGTASADKTKMSWHQDDAGGYLVLQQQGDIRSNALFDAPPVAGKVAEFELGAGLKARVALTLTDAQAKPSPDRAANLLALKARLTAIPDPKTAATSNAQREADVVVAWNVFRHFYPYWDVIYADWDAELPLALADADKADSRALQRQVLQHLLAPLEDAHGTVFDPTVKHAALPVAMAPVEGRWVVVATAVPDTARVGDVVTAMDGVSAQQVAEKEESLTSGQPTSRPWKALQLVSYGTQGESHNFTLRHADGSTSTATLAYSEKTLPDVARPAPVAELKPGIWYVDVARTDMAMFSANLAKLASARAVIYDIRGYPKDSHVSSAIPAHLLDHAENAKWMHLPRHTGPFGELAGYTDIGWDIQPAQPHFTSRAIFLADGGSISQSESIMGYVQDDNLGTIVGSTTSGVNGNVTSFFVPSGFGVIFTGMKVTHHDGTSRYHALGTPADVVVQPTITGIRAGRDEVLDAALKLAK
jgi:hypothetical protein